MIFWAEKFIWCGALALGFQFLYTGIRVRFDRSFAWFGSSLLLFSLLFIGDAWGLRNPLDAAEYARWTFLAHAAALALLPSLILFFFHITGVFLRAGLAGFLLVDLSAAIFFLRDSLLDGGSFRSVDPPAGYGLLFLPCSALGLLLISLALGMKIRTSRGRELSLFALLGLGFSAVALPCMLSALALARSRHDPAPQLPLFGLLPFVLASVYLLTERFLSLHRANRDSMRKLGNAYAELQESSKLKDLGISAASISHEIRNYVATLRGNALLLHGSLDSIARREEVERIHVTVDRMETVSRDIASYSQASLSLHKASVALDEIARECILCRFPSRQKDFRIQPWGSGPRVSGDSGKLEQVFLNLFKNALEAGARRVELRFKSWGDRLVVAIEDDGSGCSPENLDRLAVPFFSGKGEGGTGLGCAIAEAILGAHGATMRSYCKNALSAGAPD